MTRLVLLLLAFAACDRPLHRWAPDIEVETEEVQPWQEESQDYAAERVRDEWGLELDGVWTHIYWTVTPCPGVENVSDPWKGCRLAVTPVEKPLTAVVWKGECYHGLTFDCSEMYIADRGTMGDSALLHELGHCFLLWDGYDGDGDHSNKEFWQMMTTIQTEVKENGW